MKIRAIVLSFDKHRPLVDHMIFKYEEVWPQHPFIFRIPYQNLNNTDNQNREYVECPPDIKGTVLTLLSGLDDDEWIYWCIDDKYPIFLDLSKIEQVIDWVAKVSSNQCSGVLFCRCRKTLNGKALRQEQLIDTWSNIYLRRKDYSQIWIHQFLRVKVLQHLFINFPDEILKARMMDDLKKRVVLPESHQLFVTSENFAVFGESTLGGTLTLNCYQSIQEHNLVLPSIPVDLERTIIMGEARNQF